MYMDEIQYTFKHVKLVLILSIHKNERYVLKNLKMVKPKTKTIELVCVYLCISRLIYSYT